MHHIIAQERAKEYLRKRSELAKKRLASMLHLSQLANHGKRKAEAEAFLREKQRLACKLSAAKAEAIKWLIASALAAKKDAAGEAMIIKKKKEAHLFLLRRVKSARVKMAAINFLQKRAQHSQKRLLAQEELRERVVKHRKNSKKKALAQLWLAARVARAAARFAALARLKHRVVVARKHVAARAWLSDCAANAAEAEAARIAALPKLTKAEKAKLLAEDREARKAAARNAAEARLRAMTKEEKESELEATKAKLFKLKEIARAARFTKTSHVLKRFPEPESVHKMIQVVSRRLAFMDYIISRPLGISSRTDQEPLPQWRLEDTGFDDSDEEYPENDELERWLAEDLGDIHAAAMHRLFVENSKHSMANADVKYDGLDPLPAVFEQTEHNIRHEVSGMSIEQRSDLGIMLADHDMLIDHRESRLRLLASMQGKKEATMPSDEWRVERLERKHVLAEGQSSGDIMPMVLDEWHNGKCQSIHPKFFTLHLKEKRLLSIKLRVKSGRAQLFVATASLPSLTDFVWKSDVFTAKQALAPQVTISPFDPHHVAGEDSLSNTYYVGVFCMTGGRKNEGRVHKAKFEVMATCFAGEDEEKPSRAMRSVSGYITKFRAVGEGLLSSSEEDFDVALANIARDQARREATLLSTKQPEPDIDDGNGGGPAGTVAARTNDVAYGSDEEILETPGARPLLPDPFPDDDTRWHSGFYDNLTSVQSTVPALPRQRPSTAGTSLSQGSSMRPDTAGTAISAVAEAYITEQVDSDIIRKLSGHLEPSIGRKDIGRDTVHVPHVPEEPLPSLLATPVSYETSQKAVVELDGFRNPVLSPLSRARAKRMPGAQLDGSLKMSWLVQSAVEKRKKTSTTNKKGGKKESLKQQKKQPARKFLRKFPAPKVVKYTL